MQDYGYIKTSTEVYFNLKMPISFTNSNDIVEIIQYSINWFSWYYHIGKIISLSRTYER